MEVTPCPLILVASRGREKPEPSGPSARPLVQEGPRQDSQLRPLWPRRGGKLTPVPYEESGSTRSRSTRRRGWTNTAWGGSRACMVNGQLSCDPAGLTVKNLGDRFPDGQAPQG